MDGIHPTARVHPGAQISEDVRIGAYSIIGENVKIGPGCEVASHVVIEGISSIGSGNRIFSGAVIGSIPQDLKYRGEQTEVVIGDRNTIREFVTVNTGTAAGGGKTVIGSDNLIMAYVHIAHDCIIANRVVLSNCATLGGHVILEDRVIVSGLTALHHYVRVGCFAMLGGCSKIVLDVPPYMLCEGNPAKVYGLNVVGLRRNDIPPENRECLKKAFKLLYNSGLNRTQAISRIRKEIPQTDEIRHLLEFIGKIAEGKSGRAFQK